MPNLMSTADVDVIVDHHLFGVCDGAADESPPPAPREVGHRWLSTGVSMVYFEADEDILDARVRFESWDGPPPEPDAADWPETETVVLSLPSAVLSIDEITAGVEVDVFVVGRPGRYFARLAWREGPLDLDDTGEPEGFALAQFWPA